MKLSDETISVLQNFQTINPSIVISSGNVIRTISVPETIFAKATLQDSFPKRFGIYDLSKFLGILSLNKNSEVEFHEHYMTISQDRSRIRYSYCNPELIKSPDEQKDIALPSVDVTFELKNEVLKEVTKAMSVLGFNEICFRGADGILSVQTFSSKNDNSDVYSHDIGETSKTFSVILEADKLKTLPCNYTVSITKMGLAHFYSPFVEYGVGISTRSSFDG
jgi:hypothetical protein